MGVCPRKFLEYLYLGTGEESITAMPKHLTAPVLILVFRLGTRENHLDAQNDRAGHRYGSRDYDPGNMNSLLILCQEHVDPRRSDAHGRGYATDAGGPLEEFVVPFIVHVGGAPANIDREKDQ